MKSLCFIFFLSILFAGCSDQRIHVLHQFADAEKIKLCLVGDLGKDSPLQARMATALGQEQCDRIYFLGDLVYPKGIKNVNDPQLEERFLHYYRPLYEERPELQLSLVMGNHDYRGKTKAWIKLAEQNKNIFFPSYYFMEVMQGLCVIGLDTNSFLLPKYTHRAAGQGLWLNTISPHLDDCQVKVAISHHPLRGGNYDPAQDWDGATGLLRQFLKKWIIGEVDIHVAGHVHTLVDDGEQEGTQMLISGTGGEIKGTESVPGFVVLNYRPRQHPKKIFYTLRRLGPDSKASEGSKDSEADEEDNATNDSESPEDL